MNARPLIIALLVLLPVLGAAPAHGRDDDAPDGFEEARTSLQQKLEDALAELTDLRETIAAEQIPLSRELTALESELSGVRAEFLEASRARDQRALTLSNLQAEIKSRQEESAYLAGLLGEYVRNFDSRLHIAERARYEAEVREALRAAEAGTDDEAVNEAQINVVTSALGRLEDMLGGVRFEGSAVDDEGLVQPGVYVMLGPAALFRSADGAHIGAVDQKTGSLEPRVIPFRDPTHAAAAAQVITSLTGSFPLDPTLGAAHVIEATQDTLWQHVQKGGPVMIPIFVLAGAALLVAIYKWIALSLIRRPSRRRVNELLRAVGRRDHAVARQAVKAIQGPAGEMLAAGVDHLDEPRELIEEVMYEKVLTTRLKANRMLPFIAISAAAAPLLGLLGTVTGIINTFKLITVFGTGDVKTLSGGISEALITTKFGLIVAIPSLLLHAFLARRARGVVDQMEQSAILFTNEVGRAQAQAARRRSAASRSVAAPAGPRDPDGEADASELITDDEFFGRTPEREEVQAHVKEALVDLLTPAVRESIERRPVS